MCNNPRKLIVLVKDNPICPRFSTTINIPITQNRELVVCPGNREIEPFVVVVLMRVGVVGLSGAVQVPAGGLGSGHRAGGVADAGAGVGAGALLGGCVCEGDEEEDWKGESLVGVS